MVAVFRITRCVKLDDDEETDVISQGFKAYVFPC